MTPPGWATIIEDPCVLYFTRERCLAPRYKPAGGTNLTAPRQGGGFYSVDAVDWLSSMKATSGW